MSWGSSKSWESIPALDRNGPDTCYRLDTISMLRPKFQRLEAWKLFQQGRLKCVCFKLFQQGSFKTSKLIALMFDACCFFLKAFRFAAFQTSKVFSVSPRFTASLLPVFRHTKPTKPILMSRDRCWQSVSGISGANENIPWALFIQSLSEAPHHNDKCW